MLYSASDVQLLDGLPVEAHGFVVAFVFESRVSVRLECYKSVTGVLQDCHIKRLSQRVLKEYLKPCGGHDHPLSSVMVVGTERQNEKKTDSETDSETDRQTDSETDSETDR
jgi:hypothetical protein